MGVSDALGSVTKAKASERGVMRLPFSRLRASTLRGSDVAPAPLRGGVTLEWMLIGGDLARTL